MLGGRCATGVGLLPLPGGGRTRGVRLLLPPGPGAIPGMDGPRFPSRAPTSGSAGRAEQYGGQVLLGERCCAQPLPSGLGALQDPRAVPAPLALGRGLGGFIPPALWCCRRCWSSLGLGLSRDRGQKGLMEPGCAAVWAGVRGEAALAEQRRPFAPSVPWRRRVYAGSRQSAARVWLLPGSGCARRPI